MSEIRAFAPMYTPGGGNAAGTLAPSTTIIASVAAATNAVPFAGALTNYQQQILVTNTTTAWAYINFGQVGAVVAATVAASLPVAPGVGRVFTVDKEVTAASVILGVAPGTNTAVIFTRGEGL